MYLNLVLVVIMVFVFGGLARGGLWSNTIALFNTILAAIVASCFFEPASKVLTDMALPSAVHVWDIVIIGAIFGLTFTFLRLITERISKYRVRFHPLVDGIGGAVVALWVAWTTVCFICFTLHLAPLTRNFLDGGFDAESKMFFGAAPDRLWLGFLQSQSKNGGLGDAQFDPRSEFMVKYASRRTWLDGRESLLVD